MIPTSPPSQTRLRHSCTDRCAIDTVDGPQCVDAIVAAHPDGLSAEALGQMLGLTKQGVEYVVDEAARKVAPALNGHAYVSPAALRMRRLSAARRVG